MLKLDIKLNFNEISNVSLCIKLNGINDKDLWHINQEGIIKIQKQRQCLSLALDCWGPYKTNGPQKSKPRLEHCLCFCIFMILCAI